MSNDFTVQRSAEQAARALDGARLVCVSAGAGMGVDSGLPDFRGPEGFWRAYPPYRALGLAFEDMANPAWFREDPFLAWGFYGHRLQLYRDTMPHAGFGILKEWIAQAPDGGVVVTANVDGHFQRAGIDERVIEEHHGSIHHLQCLGRCGIGVFAASGTRVSVDQDGRARGELPSCPACGALARPAILMFGDRDWDGRRSRAQAARVRQILGEVNPAQIVVIECGAGLTVPSMRRFSEQLAARGATLVRINPRDPAVPAGGISLACGALEGLRVIAETRLGGTGASSGAVPKPG